jgi:integrase
VFPTSGGNTVRYPYFHERVWKPLLNRVKLPYRKYHATRHSYATWLLDAAPTSDGCRLSSGTPVSVRPPIPTGTFSLSATSPQSRD